MSAAERELEVAGHDPDTDPRLLLELLKHPALAIRAAALSNPSTPRAALMAVVATADIPDVLFAAANQAIGREQVHGLLLSPDAALRSAAARNRHLLVEEYEALSRDDDEVVRAELAGNPRAPEHVLRLLAEDPTLHGTVTGNPSAPLDVLGGCPIGEVPVWQVESYLERAQVSAQRRATITSGIDRLPPDTKLASLVDDRE